MDDEAVIIRSLRAALLEAQQDNRYLREQLEEKQAAKPVFVFPARALNPLKLPIGLAGYWIFG